MKMATIASSFRAPSTLTKPIPTTPRPFQERLLLPPRTTLSATPLRKRTPLSPEASQTRDGATRPAQRLLLHRLWIPEISWLRVETTTPCMPCPPSTASEIINPAAPQALLAEQSRDGRP